MAGSERYSISSTILLHLTTLSLLAFPTMVTSTFTSICPPGSHPVLAPGPGIEWYSVCCPSQTTIVVGLTSNGPRCCTQPTLSDSLNLVPVSEWSTCNNMPVSAESCTTNRNEQVWNDFNMQICREADNTHSLFPPRSMSQADVNSEDEPDRQVSEIDEFSAEKIDDAASRLSRQITAVCAPDDTPVSVPNPDVRGDPKIVCCNALYNQRAIQRQTGIFCCLNGSDTCDMPADNVLGCPWRKFH